MSNEHVSNNIDRVKVGSKIWEGGFGRSRFRALWDRGPGYLVSYAGSIYPK